MGVEETKAMAEELLRRVRLWADPSKGMLAFYTEERCIDVHFKREGVELGKDEVIVEFWEKDRLTKSSKVKGDQLGTLGELLEFLRAAST